MNVMVKNILVCFMLHSAAEGILCIRTLIHSEIRPQDVIQLFSFVIRTVWGYACPEWHLA
jgi:hypothetical protein